MGTINLPIPEVGATDKQTIQNLYDTILKYRKELQFLLYHLDGNNIQPGSITADSIATDTLIVGENIQMSPNATLTWENIADKPNGLMTEDLFNTVIGEDYIVTGKIRANQITAGVLTGFTIRTNFLNFSRIELAEDGFKTYNGSNQLNGVYMDTMGGSSSFRIFKADVHRFSIFYGQDTGDTVDKLRLTTNAGVPMKLQSGSDMSLSAIGKIYFDSPVQFSAGSDLTVNVVAKFA